MMLYFAYGSNLNWVQTKERCPSARFVCVAKFPGHRLAFTRKSQERGCGVADVVPTRGCDTWGVVYEIDARDIGQLDKSEGFRPDRSPGENAYVRRENHVYDGGDEEKPLLVSVYFANKEKNPPLPDAEYKQLIVEGAKFWHLPLEYVSQLEQIEVAS